MFATLRGVNYFSYYIFIGFNIYLYIYYLKYQIFSDNKAIYIYQMIIDYKYNKTIM